VVAVSFGFAPDADAGIGRGPEPMPVRRQPNRLTIRCFQSCIASPM